MAWSYAWHMCQGMPSRYGCPYVVFLCLTVRLLWCFHGVTLHLSHQYQSVVKAGSICISGSCGRAPVPGDEKTGIGSSSS